MYLYKCIERQEVHLYHNSGIFVSEQELGTEELPHACISPGRESQRLQNMLGQPPARVSGEKRRNSQVSAIIATGPHSLL